MKIALLSLFVSSALAIWPIPSSLSTGNSTLWIDEGVVITYNGPSHVGFMHLQDAFNQYTLNRNTDQIVSQTASYSSNGNTTSAASSLTAAVIQAAISRTSRTLFQQNFLPWKFHPRNTNFPSSSYQKVTIRSITLQQTQPDPATLANPHAGDIDES
jgi:hexosaminidase